MPWQECSSMSLRFEFVQLAQQPNTNFSELCRRFSISCKTGYKWLKRFQQDGAVGLADQTRRPHRSPRRTENRLEQRGLAVEWASKRISVVDVAPGYIETDLNRAALTQGALKDYLARRIPTGAHARPDAISRMVAAIFCENVAFLTGETIYVDGGQGIAH